jgi:hypothetical protein
MPRGGLIFSLVALAGIGIFAFAVGVLMLPYSSIVGERISELTCLQLAFTSERATAVILSFSPEAQAAIAKLLVPGDLMFAWFYGFLLAGLLALLARRLEGAWFRAGAVAMWFPLLASVLDDVEDLLLHNMVTTILADPAASVPASAALLAGLAASFKYLFLSVLTPAFAVAGSVQGLKTDRSFGALITYLLVCLVALSMVPKLFNEAPACF